MSYKVRVGLFRDDEDIDEQNLNQRPENLLSGFLPCDEIEIPLPQA